MSHRRQAIASVNEFLEPRGFTPLPEPETDDHRVFLQSLLDGLERKRQLQPLDEHEQTDYDRWSQELGYEHAEPDLNERYGP